MKKIFALLIIFPIILCAQSGDDTDVPYAPHYVYLLNCPGSPAYASCVPTYIVKQTLISPTINNGGFETAGAGGADVFATWVESTNGGRIADTSSSVGGGHAMVIQCDASMSDSYVSQDILLTGRTYRITFSAKSDAGAGISIKVGSSSGVGYVSQPITTTYATYTAIFTASSIKLVIERVALLSANRLYVIDNITLEEIEGSMDLNAGELLPNPFCDVNVTGHSSSGGTLTYSTLQKYAGAGSALTALTAGSSKYIIRSTALPDSSSTKRTFEAWERPNRGMAIRPIILDQVGSFLLNGAPVWCPPNVFTKLTANVQLPGTQTGVSVATRADTAQVGDSVWTDNISLTQSSDAVVAVFGVNAGNRNFVGWEGIVLAGTPSTTAWYGLRGYNTANTFMSTMVDNSQSPSYSNASILANGKTHNIYSTVNRPLGAQYVYTDDTKTAVGALTVGRISGITSIYIGINGVTYFTGSLGQTYIIRYWSGLPSDIDTKVATANQRYKIYGYVEPWVWGPTADIVGNWDWKNRGRDSSPYGNNLILQGGAVVVKKQ